MKGIIVRRLDAADVGIASEVATVLLGEGSVPREHLTQLLGHEQNILIVALAAEGIPVGFVMAHRFPSLSGETLVYLYDILVEEAYRRQGVASAMVRQLQEISMADGADRIWVGSGRENQAACVLWESLGGRRVSETYVEFTFELPGAAK